MRVLRKPGDVGPSIDHALMNLEEYARSFAAARRRITHRDLSILGGAHERGLHLQATRINVPISLKRVARVRYFESLLTYATRHAVLVLLAELIREHRARKTSVDLGGYGQPS